MTITRRSFLRGASLLTTSLVLDRAWATNAKTVRYGGSAWLGHYPAYLAMTQGYLKAAGIEQDFQSFGTSSSRMSAIMSGDVDIACTGIVSALALMARGAKQFSIIATPESFGRVEGILGRADIPDVAGLKGKKIGVSFASSAHLLVLDVLAQAGLTSQDVTVLNVPAPELPAAMQSGQIDAAAAWTPQFDAIRAQPGVRLIVDDTQFSLYKSWQVTPGPDVLVVRNAWARENRAVLDAWLHAYFQATALLRDQAHAAAQALTTLTNLALENQLAVVRGADWYSRDQQKDLLQGAYVEGLQHLAELLVTHKQIDKAPVVKDWVDASYV